MILEDLWLVKRTWHLKQEDCLTQNAAQRVSTRHVCRKEWMVLSTDTVLNETVYHVTTPLTYSMMQMHRYIVIILCILLTSVSVICAFMKAYAHAYVFYACVCVLLTSIIAVASALVFSHILLSWFSGPIRNIVLHTSQLVFNTLYIMHPCYIDAINYVYIAHCVVVNKSVWSNICFIL